MDSCTLAGHFIGYDIESKGYRIYWPTKRTISVERNVAINDNDVTSTDDITFDILVEGERDKVIQSTPKNSETLDDLHTLEENGSQHKQEEEEVNDEPQPSNSIHFPSTNTKNIEPVPEVINETETQVYDRGQCSRKAPGEYRNMNEGLVAMVANDLELQAEDALSEYTKNYEEENPLPPDFAFVGNLCLEPRTLDKPLRGSNTWQWQTVLDYEINQLEKLGTWVVEDLPNVTPLNILRYNQAYKVLVQSSGIQKEFSCVTKSLSQE